MANRDTKSGYATPGTEKGVTPNVKSTSYVPPSQGGGLSSKIEHTYEEAPAVRRGQGLSTNGNIGCGYGTVTGKGKAD